MSYLGLCTPSRFSDESTFSFLYRALSMNCLSWGWLRNKLQLKSYAWPGYENYKALSEIFPGQLDQSDFCRGSLGCREASLYGLNFINQSQLRLIRPAVCPICIYTNQYTRKSWDIAALTACTLHNCRLIDRCDHCARSLSWHRPWITTCRCRNPLGAERTWSLGKDDLLISHCITSFINGESSLFNALHPFAGSTNLGLIIYLLTALGLNEKPYQFQDSAWSSRRYSIDSMHQLMRRGHERFMLISASGSEDLSHLAQWVHEPGLILMIQHLRTASQYEFFRQIYERIFHSDIPKKAGTNTTQLHLGF